MKLTNEQVIKLGKGQVVFEQNAPGGDLYIIESGEVILSREWLGEVTERVAGHAEILSGLTCLTNEPRWHTAKTKNEVVLRKVRWEILQRYVKALPHWLKKLVLSYSDSIHSLQQEHEAVLRKIEVLEQSRVTVWFSMRQFLTLVLDVYKTCEDQGRERCYIDDLQKRGASLLCQDPKKIRNFLELLVESGILLTHLDNDRGKLWVKVSHVDRLSNLLNICSQTKSISQELKSSPPPRVLRLVSALLIYIHKMDLSQTDKISLLITEIKEPLQALIGHEIALEHIEEAQEYKLLSIERSHENIKLRLIPQNIGLRVSCYSALKIMEKLQRSEERRAE